MGVGGIDLWDFDKVAEENLGTQGWAADAIGEYKTDEMHRIIGQLNPHCRVLSYPRKWHPTSYAAGEADGITAMFIAVDCLETRQSIMPQGDAKVPYPIIDCRMGALAMRIVAPTTAKVYRDSLPHSSQVHEAPCTERATFFCASIAAGFAINLWVQMLRGFEPVSRDFLFNLGDFSFSEATPFEEVRNGVETPDNTSNAAA